MGSFTFFFFQNPTLPKLFSISERFVLVEMKELLDCDRVRKGLMEGGVNLLRDNPEVQCVGLEAW